MAAALQYVKIPRSLCCSDIDIDISCTVISTLKLLSFGSQTCVASQEEVTIGYEHNIWIYNN